MKRSGIKFNNPENYFEPKIIRMADRSKWIHEEVNSFYEGRFGSEGVNKKEAQVFSNTGVGNAGANITVSIPQPYIPEFASPDRLFFPSNPKQAMKYWRFFYALDPVCGNVIDMYAEMMMSEMELAGESLTDEIRDICYAALDKTQALGNFRWLITGYMVDGEVIPHLVWDDDEGMWSYLGFQDPINVIVEDVPFIGVEPYLEFEIPASVRKLLQSTDPRLQRFRENVPTELINAVMAGQNIVLDTEENVTFIPRRLSPYDVRGVSIFSRLWRILMYEDAIFNASIQTARRHAAPVKVVKLGNPATGWIPGPEQEAKMRNLLAVAETDPHAWLLYHYGCCLTPGSKVIMGNYSLKNIEEVKIGDIVIDKNGSKQKVIDSWGLPHIGEIIELDIVGGEKITCTPEHKWPVFAQPRYCACGCGEEVKNWKSFGFNHHKRLTGKEIDFKNYGKTKTKVVEGYDPYQKLEAKDIRDGDYLMIPRKFNKEEKEVSEKELLLARLLGYYIAEGYVDLGSLGEDKRVDRRGGYYSLGFTFNLTEETYIEDIINIVSRVSNQKYIEEVRRSQVPACITLGFKSKEWRNKEGTVRCDLTNGGRGWMHIPLDIADWLVKNGGRFSDKKKLSEKVMEWPLSMKKELVIGYFRGDGCGSSGQILASTISYELAQQMKIVFAQLGIRLNVRRYSMSDCHKNINVSTWKDQYFMEFSGEEVEEFRDNIFGFVKKRRRLFGKKKNTSWWSDENYIYVKIRKVNRINYSGLVYNLSVSGDHSYLVEGIGTYNSFEAWGTTDRVMTINREWDIIERIKLVALGASKAFLTGEVTYACSPKDAEILMEDFSSKNIEDVKIGDRVIDIFFQKKEVTDVLVYPSPDEMIKIITESGKKIIVTDNHELPVYMEDNYKDIRRVKARDIKLGYRLSNAMGSEKFTKIRSIEKIKVDKERHPKVYSLTVEGSHSYFINGLASFNSAEKGLQVFLARLKGMRTFFESKWWYPRFFKVMAEKNEWIKPTEAEVSHNVKVKRSKKELRRDNRYIVPSIVWNQTLDPQSKTDLVRLYMDISDRLGIKISKTTIAAQSGLDWEEEERRFREEEKITNELNQEMGTPEKPKEEGQGGGLGGGFPSGEEIPVSEGGAEEEVAEETPEEVAPIEEGG